jgi:hypothetical protein
MLPSLPLARATWAADGAYSHAIEVTHLVIPRVIGPDRYYLRYRYDGPDGELVVEARHAYENDKLAGDSVAYDYTSLTGTATRNSLYQLRSMVRLTQFDADEFLAFVERNAPPRPQLLELQLEIAVPTYTSSKQVFTGTYAHHVCDVPDPDDILYVIQGSTEIPLRVVLRVWKRGPTPWLACEPLRRPEDQTAYTKLLITCGFKLLGD